MASTDDVTNIQAAVAQVLADYYRAFSTLDLKAFLPYFHEPCVIIGPQGVFTATAHAALGPAFTPAMDDLRARGFVRSELSLQQITALSATAAIARGIAIRRKAGNAELNRAGVTYVLHKTDFEWKIVVLVLHDPDAS